MSEIQLKYDSTYDTGLDYPFKSCILNDELYLCDRQNDKIQVFDISNDSFVYDREFGFGVLSLPEDITTDGTNLYIVDTGNDRILKTNTIGSSFFTVTPASYTQPLAIECDGTNLYIVFQNTVVKTTLAGVEVLSFGGDGIFNFPRGIEVYDGFIYIADTYNSRVLKYTDLGVFVKSLADINFKRPAGIEYIDGILCITDLTGGRIHFVQPDLENYSNIGSYGSGQDNFAFPVGVVGDGERLFISDSANHRLQIYTYIITTEIDYSEDVTSTLVDLYPTSQWFNLNEGSTIFKVHDAIGTFMSRAWNSIKDIGGWILPDNVKFNIEAIENWERVFGIPVNTDKTFDQRKDVIEQRMAFPGEILARQSVVYIESQLQLAGFDVKVTYNRFTNTVGNPTNCGTFNCGGANVGSTKNYANRFVRNEPDPSYTAIIANNIYNDRDIGIFGTYDLFLREIQLRGTFFIHADPYPTLVDIPLNREKEFRDLVLKLKPAQTVCLGYINWTT